MAREADAQSLAASRITIGNGASTFVFINGVPGQVSIQFSILGSGGTLEIASGLTLSGFSAGSTGAYAGNSPTLLQNGQGYPILAGEVFEMDGQPNFWLSSGGTTTTIRVIRTLSTLNGI